MMTSVNDIWMCTSPGCIDIMPLCRGADCQTSTFVSAKTGHLQPTSNQFGGHFTPTVLSIIERLTAKHQTFLCFFDVIPEASERVYCLLKKTSTLSLSLRKSTSSLSLIVTESQCQTGSGTHPDTPAGLLPVGWPPWCRRPVRQWQMAGPRIGG